MSLWWVFLGAGIFIGWEAEMVYARWLYKTARRMKNRAIKRTVRGR